MESGQHSLRSCDVHLWHIAPAAVSHPRQVQQCSMLLAADEETRRQRYTFEDGRHTFLVTRALVRTVLSLYAPVEPAAWQFTANAHGKPAIAAPTLPEPLQFNLSHTQGRIVCGVTRAGPIGVDVEYRQRHVDALPLAGRYFSERETAELHGRPPHEQPERFLDYWTLKESYIKGRGLGLALPLDRFSFYWDEAGCPRIDYTPDFDVPESWQFVQLHLGDEHKVAVGVRPSAGTSQTLRVTCFDAAPLWAAL